MMEYYTAKQVKELLKVTNTTLMRYRETGVLRYSRVSDRKILYEKPQVDALLSGKPLTEEINDKNNKLNIIYCRVSTTKQREDLIKQEQLLKDYCNVNGIIIDKVFSEIASGMNEDREQLNKLLKMVTENKIDKIYITYKDRLTRFGFGYIQNICKIFDVEIIVLNNVINQESFETELSNDLISIIHHFSMKMYGKRRSELNKIKKELEQ